MLVYVTLNSATMLLGFFHDTEKEVSVILLNIKSVGGSGPGKNFKKLQSTVKEHFKVGAV